MRSGLSPFIMVFAHLCGKFDQIYLQIRSNSITHLSTGEPIQIGRQPLLSQRAHTDWATAPWATASVAGATAPTTDLTGVGVRVRPSPCMHQCSRPPHPFQSAKARARARDGQGPVPSHDPGPIGPHCGDGPCRWLCVAPPSLPPSPPPSLHPSNHPSPAPSPLLTSSLPTPRWIAQREPGGLAHHLSLAQSPTAAPPPLHSLCRRPPPAAADSTSPPPRRAFLSHRAPLSVSVEVGSAACQMP